MSRMGPFSGPRRIGARGLKLIQDFESLRLVAYDDGGGVWTIGWGHTKGVKPGDICTRAQADAWLAEDCAEAEAAVSRLVRVDLSANQFDALVSFVFNLGADEDADTKAEGLGDSTLLRLLNWGNYVGAADEFPKWNKDNGVVLAGLVRRRAAERNLFLAND